MQVDYVSEDIALPMALWAMGKGYKTKQIEYAQFGKARDVSFHGPAAAHFKYPAGSMEVWTGSSGQDFAKSKGTFWWQKYTTNLTFGFLNRKPLVFFAIVSYILIQLFLGQSYTINMPGEIFLGLLAVIISQMISIPGILNKMLEDGKLKGAYDVFGLIIPSALAVGIAYLFIPYTSLAIITAGIIAVVSGSKILNAIYRYYRFDDSRTIGKMIGLFPKLVLLFPAYVPLYAAGAFDGLRGKASFIRTVRGWRLDRLNLILKDAKDVMPSFWQQIFVSWAMIATISLSIKIWYSFPLIYSGLFMLSVVLWGLTPFLSDMTGKTYKVPATIGYSITLISMGLFFYLLAPILPAQSLLIPLTSVGFTFLFSIAPDLTAKIMGVKTTREDFLKEAARNISKGEMTYERMEAEWENIKNASKGALTPTDKVFFLDKEKMKDMLITIFAKEFFKITRNIGLAEKDKKWKRFLNNYKGYIKDNDKVSFEKKIKELLIDDFVKEKLIKDNKKLEGREGEWDALVKRYNVFLSPEDKDAFKQKLKEALVKKFVEGFTQKPEKMKTWQLQMNDQIKTYADIFIESDGNNIEQEFKKELIKNLVVNIGQVFNPVRAKNIQWELVMGRRQEIFPVEEDRLSFDQMLKEAFVDDLVAFFLQFPKISEQEKEQRWEYLKNNSWELISEGDREYFNEELSNAKAKVARKEQILNEKIDVMMGDRRRLEDISGEWKTLLSDNEMFLSKGDRALFDQKLADAIHTQQPAHMQLMISKENFADYYADGIDYKGFNNVVLIKRLLRGKTKKVEMIVGGFGLKTFEIDNELIVLSKKYDIDIETIIQNAIGNMQQTRGPDAFKNMQQGPIYISLLDRSTSIFENHTQDNFIGINRILFDKLSDKLDKQQLNALLTIGITHELMHEAGLSGNTEEDEMVLSIEDVSRLFRILSLDEIKQMKTILEGIFEKGMFLEELEKQISEKEQIKTFEYEQGIKALEAMVVNRYEQAQKDNKKVIITFDGDPGTGKSFTAEQFKTNVEKLFPNARVKVMDMDAFSQKSDIENQEVVYEFIYKQMQAEQDTFDVYILSGIGVGYKTQYDLDPFDFDQVLQDWVMDNEFLYVEVSASENVRRQRMSVRDGIKLRDEYIEHMTNDVKHETEDVLGNPVHYDLRIDTSKAGEIKAPATPDKVLIGIPFTEDQALLDKAKAQFAKYDFIETVVLRSEDALMVLQDIAEEKGIGFAAMFDINKADQKGINVSVMADLFVKQLDINRFNIVYAHLAELNPDAIADKDVAQLQDILTIVTDQLMSLQNYSIDEKIALSSQGYWQLRGLTADPSVLEAGTLFSQLSKIDAVHAAVVSNVMVEADPSLIAKIKVKKL
ncbi:MAG: DMT family transporter, partial [Candidatus Omnitrophica bacterium]|nr:DMT family transporter [Candidatus Omnitrophota bacterium]